MYKHVIAIGDSFLEGAELTYPLPDKNYVAPALIAQKLNLDFYNLATSGVGMLAVLEQLKFAEQAGILAGSLVVYSIPPTGRIDFPEAQDSRFTLDYWFHKNILDGKFDGPKAFLEGIEQDEKYNKFKRLYQAVPTVDYVTFGEQIQYTALAALEQQLQGVTAVGICGHPQHFTDSYWGSKAQLVLKRLNPMFVTEGFTGWAKNNNYSIMPYGHPGKDAHQALSYILEEHV